MAEPMALTYFLHQGHGHGLSSLEHVCVCLARRRVFADLYTIVFFGKTRSGMLSSPFSVQIPEVAFTLLRLRVQGGGHAFGWGAEIQTAASSLHRCKLGHGKTDLCRGVR